jgi:alkylation response protein AidB-like acyl-CoA dehydrogenase
MNFALTAEQELLRDTARALLARECPTSVVRAYAEDPAAAAPLWEHVRQFAALGAGPTVDLCVFAEETGYVAAPGPFLTTAALAGPLLAAAGDDRATGLLTGDRTGTIAIAGADGEWRPNDDPVKTFVLEADRVDVVAVVAVVERTPSLRVVEPAVERLSVRPITTVDLSRRVFEVDAPSAAASTPLHGATLDAVLARCTVVLAAELVGTARRLFDMTLQYAKERHQFGVPIGSFQVIQHKLADMALDVERAWSAVYYAAMTIDAGDGSSASERKRAVHVAKAAAGEAAKRAAKDGIQIHGGIGYTWEHDLHLFIRRAYASEALLGTTGWHHDRLAALLFAGPGRVGAA